MNSTSNWIMRGLILAVPIVLSGTIATAPSRAFSVATARGELTLDNFSQAPVDLTSDVTTNTIAIATPGTGSLATADAQADAAAAVEAFTQFSSALAFGVGPSYFSRGDASSITQGTFATSGLFQFNFRARLTAVALALLPGETATANSSVGFSLFERPDSTTPIDFFRINAIAVNQPPTISSTPNSYVAITSFLQLAGGTAAQIEGTYSRDFGRSINLLLEGRTETSAVAQVPEPPVTVAMIIVPGLLAWKRMRMARQARSKVTINS